MQAMNQRTLNLYMRIPGKLESDWISLLRQFGFLNTACQEKGITLNVHRSWKTGFRRMELSENGPCICAALMDEADYTAQERMAATELLKRGGVACVIGLLKSESDSVACYEVDGSALHIIHYSEPSEVRISELPAIQRLLNALAANGAEDDGSRIRQIHPGLIAGCGSVLSELLRTNPDAIAVLDSLPGDIWDLGFRRDILYYPIKPCGTLPFLILERLAADVASRLEDGQRVALFSGEDSGCVGYVAACVLFLRGIRKPIDYLRQSWDASALSVEAQESSVRLFCYKHVVRDYRHCVQLARHIQIDSVEAFKSDRAIQWEVSRINDALGSEGRITFRFSEFLPSVRVLVEAPTMAQCESAIDALIDVLKLRGRFVGIVQGW